MIQPLLPGYDPQVNVRSSTIVRTPFLKRLSDAEENGYQGPYFTLESNENNEDYISGGFIPSSSPEAPLHTAPSEERPKPKPRIVEENVAEVVFFAYGVVVFFNLSEDQEKMIIDDLDNALVLVRKIDDNKWETEECHFSVSSSARSTFLNADKAL